MLESCLHSDKCFVTLTYQDQNLPLSASGPTLVPADLQLCLKRLRKRIAPSQIRFFAVGEYGEASWRPHYHLALFGYRACDRGITRAMPGSGRSDWGNCCHSCLIVGQAWGHGDIQIGQLSKESAQYLAGYVVKKLTGKMEALYGERYPEFTRMSLKPGIGLGAMDEVASSIMAHKLADSCDVPSGLRHGSRIYPLGRYLRNALRVRVGHDEGAHPATIAQLEEAVREVREYAFENSVSFASALVERSEGSRASIAARHSIYKSRRTI